jgi:hypothetical protein
MTEPEFWACNGVRWAAVKGFPGYCVSDQGEVRGPRGKPLKQTVGGRAKNYKRVMLGGGSSAAKRHAYVHHLVAEAFLGPRPEGALILHANDDGFDNRLANLRYGDRDENEMDRHVAAVAKDLPDAPF